MNHFLKSLQFFAVLILFSVTSIYPQATGADTTLAPPATTDFTTTSPQSTTNTPPSTTPESKKDAIDCPASCTCSPAPMTKGIRIDCSDINLVTIPNLYKYSNVTEINLSNNLIETLDTTLLPVGTLIDLDISNNIVKRVAFGRRTHMYQLKSLNLSGNALVDLSNSFNLLKLPSLDLLDLSNNPIEKLSSANFDNCKKVTLLHLSQLNSLETIGEQTFSSLPDLKALRMASGTLKGFRLGDKLFSNQKLQILNISNNSLLEVPHAIRQLTSLKMLFIDKNLMTSLRQSDFMYLNNLNTLSITSCPLLASIDDFTFSGMSQLRFLVIKDNPHLKYISPDAFKSPQNVTINIAILNLSGNNLTTIHDPRLFNSLTVSKVDLSKNPFNCDCDMKWIANLPLLTAPVHCGGPEKFKDLEVSAFFAAKNCDTVVESSYQTLIVAGFLLFLTGILITIFVQRSEVCRRLLWKDQYGTIYYTKASFPPETV